MVYVLRPPYVSSSLTSRFCMRWQKKNRTKEQIKPEGCTFLHTGHERNAQHARNAALYAPNTHSTDVKREPHLCPHNIYAVSDHQWWPWGSDVHTMQLLVHINTFRAFFVTHHWNSVAPWQLNTRSLVLTPCFWRYTEHQRVFSWPHLACEQQETCKVHNMWQVISRYISSFQKAKKTLQICHPMVRWAELAVATSVRLLYTVYATTDL